MTDAAEMAHASFRRIITGVDAEGKSTASIGPAPIEDFTGGDAPLPTRLWASDVWIARPDTERVFAAHQPEAWELEPPPGGAVFRLINFPAGHAGELHSTSTLDVAVVLSGELWLVVETGEVQLRPHDCVVQLETVHAWENRSDDPCLMAVVLLSTRRPTSENCP